MLTVATPDFRILLPELILIGTALLIITWEMITRTRRHGASVFLGAAAAAAAFWAVLATWGIRSSTFGDALALDPFSSFFKAVVLAALLLTLLISLRHLREEGVTEHAEYYGLLLIAAAGMMLLAGARELITIFLSLELLSISLYVLCGFQRGDPRSNEAAVKYFILGSFGTGFLLFGMSFVYGSAGTTHLRGIAEILAANPEIAAEKGLLLGLLIMLSGFSFKISAVPFHQWSPDVYEGAPTPVTAFMATATKAAAFAALLRILFEGLPAMRGSWETLFTALAVLSMTVGNLAALAQENVKRMLAYSSIAHVGYILIGLVASERGEAGTALSAVLFYLLAYVFMNAGAFALVVFLRRAGGTGEKVADFAGLSRRSPLAAAAMLVFLFSLAGVPPTAGFAAKLGIFYSAVQGKYWFLVLAGIANAAFAAWYYLRLVVVMYMQPPAEDAPPVRGSVLLWVGIALAAAGTLAVGILPAAFFRLAREAAAALLP